MFNNANKPELVVLSTQQGVQNDSSQSRVTWNLGDVLTVQNPNHVAKITLHTMTFFNTFSNILNGSNILKVLNVWKDSNVEKSRIFEMIVPTGHYDINTLLITLNDQSRKDEGGVVYGLGTPTDDQHPQYNLKHQAFSVSMANPSRIVVKPPPYQNLGKSKHANHDYKGFYLIVDEVTRPFMRQLGLIERNQGHGAINTTSLSFAGETYQVLGFPVSWTGTDYIYPGIDDYVATNCFNLGGPNALTVSLENVYANSRNSYDSMQKGNTIALVPVEASYSYKNVYHMGTNEFGCMVPNMSMTQITLTIRDCDTGNPVDFQGNQWTATLMFEYYEMDNEDKAANALMYKTSHSINHTRVLDHNLPLSGKRKMARYEHDYT